MEIIADFGRELVEEGHDVWLIEMNGGPETDCPGLEGEEDTCPNYTFEEEAYVHWPAAIAGVLAYSEKDEVNYVGHSNGGRTALFGLNAYSQNGLNNAGEILNFSNGEWEYVDLPSHPVSKFFGIGVPSTLNGDTPFTYLARNYGHKGVENINDKKHIYMSDYGKPILLEAYKDRWYLNVINKKVTVYGVLAYFAMPFADSVPLSENVMEFYHNLAYDNETEIDLSDLEVDKLYLFNGYENDLIVPYSDAEIIYDEATSISDDNKLIYDYNELNHLENHVLITGNPLVQEDILEKLKND